MRGKVLLWIAIVAALTVGCSRNGGNDETAPVGTSGKSDTNKVTSSDKGFVHDAVIANQAEVELGRIAIQRSTNADVKKFAQMMIDDHTAAGQKLSAVASRYNIDVPAQLDDKHRDLGEKLAKKLGPDFDRDYMEAMVEGHKQVADKLESRVDKANLAEWKADMTDRTSGKKVVERAQIRTILPEKSANEVTMSINQWAGDTYPTVQAHLEAAKALTDLLKKRYTTP
jgi:putative membrane protein